MGVHESSSATDAQDRHELLTRERSAEGSCVVGDAIFIGEGATPATLLLAIPVRPAIRG